ncbi:MAG: GFA family protein [Rhodospirillales bacterium]|nr:GFA family protein [Rhodospirillales bacterium]
MTKKVTGGCHCGAVRYECEAAPLFGVTCYCTDCQTFYGGEKGLGLVLPREALRVTGEVTYYESVGGSGQPVERGFCPTCGTQLIGKPGIAPHLVSVSVGSLDDASGFQTTICVYTSSAQPWSHLPDDVPSFEKMPDQIPEA